MRKVKANKEKGLIEVEISKKKWRIMDVYINEDVNKKMESMK